jgi:1-acyl-sn-glycerol-3-phosphate acyltransferase
MKFFCGFRVFGAEKIPRAGGLLVACNHVSYLDPPLVGIGVGCREVYFLAKEGLFQQSRFFTWLITT